MILERSNFFTSSRSLALLSLLDDEKSSLFHYFFFKSCSSKMAGIEESETVFKMTDEEFEASTGSVLILGLLC